MSTKQQSLAILRKGLLLIENPRCFTVHAFARDFNGSSVAANDPHAFAFSSEGVVRRVADLVNGKHALWELAEEMGDVEKFNDSHTHAQVIESWRKTIARLEVEIAERAKA